MRMELLVQLVYMMGLRIYPMFSGYRIVTSWPSKTCLDEVRQLRYVLRILLPSTYFYTEPMITTTQQLMVFVWRKDDPNAWAFVVEHHILFGAIYHSAKP